MTGVSSFPQNEEMAMRGGEEICTYGEVGPRLERQPRRRLMLEADRSEADNTFADHALATHSFTAVQSEAYSHAGHVLCFER